MGDSAVPDLPNFVLKDFSETSKAMGSAGDSAAEAMNRLAGAMEKAAEAADRETKRREDSKEPMDLFKNQLLAATAAMSLMKTVTATTGEELLRGLTGSIVSGSQYVGKALVGLEMASVATGASIAAVGSLLGGALGLLIMAVDSAAKAQRGAVESLLQAGQSADSLRWGLGTTVDSVLKAGAQFGYSQTEAGNLARALSEAGIAIKSNRDKTDYATATQQSYTHAVALASAMAKAHGVELGEASGIVQSLGVQFGIAGKDMDPAISMFLKAQRESGIQFGAFAKITDSVYGAFKSLGSGLEEVTGITSKWGKEILRGTVSASALAMVYDSQSGSWDKVMQKMMLVQQFDPRGAAKIGITSGDQFENKYQFEKAQQSVAGQGMIAQALVNLAKLGGGPEHKQIEVFENLMETQLGFKTTLDNVEKIFHDPRAFAKVTAEDKKKSPEEMVAQMFKEGTASMAKFGTTGENLNSSVVGLTSSINGLRSSIDRKAISEGADQIMKSLSTASGWTTLLRGAASLITGGEDAHRELSPHPSRQSGGLIGNTGLYRMHAGEMVHRPGEGGGISVSAGNISVTVGSYGDVGRGLDDALGKLKVEIMSEIESQWQRAQFAQ